MTENEKITITRKQFEEACLYLDACSNHQLNDWNFEEAWELLKDEIKKQDNE